MSHRFRARVLAALLPAIVLLVPAAAHAERVVTGDALGDVVTTTVSDPFLLGGGELVPSPDNTSTDITRTVVDHRAGRLKVTASFRDLRRSFSDTVLMLIRTPRKSFTVYAHRGGSQTVSMLGGRRSDVDCHGLLTTFDQAADTVSVRVPTSCIRDPRWVQVALAVATGEVRHDPEAGDQVDAFIDDAFSDGFTDDSAPAMGPRVRRG
jgi:hypothetical protein